MPENNKTKKKDSAVKAEKKTPAQNPRNNAKKTQKKSTKIESKRKRHSDDKILLLKEEIAGKQSKKAAPARESSRTARRSAAVRITALGGLSEIGKNLYVIECANDLFIIDCGLAFPDEDMLGVDLVIPDFTYLEKNRERFRGIVLTHGHEDHIGSLPYLLKKINVPVYGTKLTLGLCENKLREHGILSECSLNVVQPRQTVKLGCMSVEFICVNHSIPDACALAVHTPAGVIVHTGDFKVDYTPIGGGIIDLARFGELGNKGVLALMSDSTNAERPGYTMSERKVGDSFRNIFGTAEHRRIIVATFASNIHRIQQIIDNAVFYERKIALVGRSMITVIHKAIELGYVKIPSGFLIDIEQVNKYPPEKIAIVTTGSQGEPLSALSRMSAGDHRQVNINPSDLVVISASPIPGNEKTVGRVINDLMKSGAEVVYESMYEVHVSGHACQDELKMMLSLTKPKFFIPVHGEYKHLVKHAQLAVKMGVPEKNIFICGLGQQLETDSNTMKITTQVTAGKVLVDGLGVGDVGTVVLRDRKKLAQDGLIIVVAAIKRGSGELMSGPDIVSRGFVYVRESEQLIDEARELMEEAIADSAGSSVNIIKNNMRDAMSDFMFQKTKRSPMILPIIMEIT
jgi:ribonuclease J